MLRLERRELHVQDKRKAGSTIRCIDGHKVSTMPALSPITAADQISSSSFIAAITVVAWSSFIQVESKILEKQGDNSVGSREAFRKRTTPMFVAAVVLFGISVTAFVYSFCVIGYIKPCAASPRP